MHGRGTKAAISTMHGRGTNVRPEGRGRLAFPLALVGLGWRGASNFSVWRVRVGHQGTDGDI